jgi:hypothetical protein
MGNACNCNKYDAKALHDLTPDDPKNAIHSSRGDIIQGSHTEIDNFQHLWLKQLNLSLKKLNKKEVVKIL